MDVTTQTFEREVLEASKTLPVVVDFWAPWCGPCRALGPVLDDVATSFGGRVKLVKVNSDENQDLSAAFNIRSIPNVIAFKDGRAVAQFMGAIPEPQVRTFFAQLLPSEATGRLFAPEFERLGFAVRWVDGAAWGRAGHLIAEWRGTGTGPRVLLIGHLDTVFEADGAFQRWERLSDSTARGPGTTDMKGGDVVLLLALRALRQAGQLDGLQITVVLTGDEEHAGSPVPLARADLVEAARWADVAIGFEDGAGDPRTAVIGRRSSGNWVLRTSGRPTHSSQIFRDGVGSGAIFEAARILAAFHDSLGAEPNLTFNPGAIVGGTTAMFDVPQGRGTAFGKTNVVAESAVVTGDIRALTPEQLARAQTVMRRIASRHLPETGATLVFEDRYPPLAPTDGNRRLLALFDAASRDLGFGPMTAADPARAGAADISFTSGLVDMALDGIGLVGDGGHTALETADLRNLPRQAKRTALVLHRLAGRPRP